MSLYIWYFISFETFFILFMFIFYNVLKNYLKNIYWYFISFETFKKKNYKKKCIQFYINLIF